MTPSGAEGASSPSPTAIIGTTSRIVLLLDLEGVAGDVIFRAQFRGGELTRSTGYGWSEAGPGHSFRN